jgi:hypothetical protein
VFTWFSNLKAVWQLSVRGRRSIREVVAGWLSNGERTHGAEHRSDVWIGIGTLLGVAGVAVMIAAWQRLPSPSMADLHPSIWDSASTAAPFIAGMVCIALALYVLGSFFFPLPLPPTRHSAAATIQPTERGGAQPTIQLAPDTTYETWTENGRTFIRPVPHEPGQGG